MQVRGSSEEGRKEAESSWLAMAKKEISKWQQESRKGREQERSGLTEIRFLPKYKYVKSVGLGKQSSRSMILTDLKGSPMGSHKRFQKCKNK